MRAYLVAVAAVGLATLLRFVLFGVVGGQGPFFPYVLALLVAAGYGGLQPGLLATALGLVLGIGLSAPVIASSGAGQSNIAITSGFFLVIGCLASALCGRLHSARRRIEEKKTQLAQAWEQVRSVVDNVIDGIITIDEKGTIGSINHAGERIFGYSADEVVGKNVKMLMPEPFATEHDKYLSSYLRTGQAQIIGIGREVIGRRKDGSTFPMDLAVSDFQVASRPYFTGIVRDITERKRTVQELARERELLQTILDRIPVMLTVYHPDAKLLRLNPEFERVTGWKSHGATGVSLMKECYPDPRYREQVRAFMESCSDGWMDIRMRTRDGRNVDTTWANLRLSHQTQVGIGIDITQRKQAEETIRQNAARLRLLLEAAETLLHPDDPDDMLHALFAKIGPPLRLDTYLHYVVDREGQTLRLASYAGISETTAQYIARLEFGQAICGTVAVQRQPILSTFIQQSKDPKAQLAKTFGFRAYACNPLVTGGKLLGTLSFASRSRDELDPIELEFLQTICYYVTVAFERISLIQQLRKADRRKDEFLATLAHELRNPLAPIRNALELMRRADDDRSLVEQARGLMERQLHRMVRLIDDLLEVSRISQGKLQLRKERVELAAVVGSAVEATRPFLDARGHHLTVALPADAVYLNADPTRLAQIFANLLDNAAKYTEEAGKISLAAEIQGDEVVVSVRDNGIGIQAEHLPHLFEMFSQIAPALERSQGGLGIGLALVKGLVKLHEGTVEARSAGTGTGSEFIVRLPLAEAPEKAEPRPDSATEKPPPRTTSCRVLVVDDNQDAAETLAMILRMMGHEAATAHDGLEALRTAKTFQPKVVLLDIGMPRMNGYEAARAIRAEPWGQGMFLVALTGWGQAEDKRQALESGCDYHLTKPVEPDTLEQLLHRLVGAHVN